MDGNSTALFGTQAVRVLMALPRLWPWFAAGFLAAGAAGLAFAAWMDRLVLRNPKSLAPGLRNLVLTYRILEYAWRFRWMFVFTFAVMGLYAQLYQGRILLVKPILDTVSREPRFDALVPFILLGVFLVPLVALLDYAHNLLERALHLRVIVAMRNDAVAHVLKLSLRFFGERRAGDLLSRLTNDVAVSQNALNALFGDIILQPFMLVALILTALVINWQLTLVVLVGLPLFAFPIFRLGRHIKKSQKRTLGSLGEMTEHMHQMFTGIRTVKAFRMESVEMREMERVSESWMKKYLKVVKAKALSSGMQEFLQSLALTGILVLGVWALSSGWIKLDIGQFAAFVICCAALNRPVKMLTKAYNTLQESLAGCERLFELMEVPPEIVDAPDAVDLPPVRGSIRFRNITFSYDRDPVIRGLDFEAKKGQVVAIVGPSGAGKSTLLDLLCRFYDPQSGTVEIDGQDIRRVRRDSLLARVAVVSQESFLFNDSIAENIRYGRPGASDLDVEAAARAANIHDFIQSIPGGYQAPAGERGAKFSGGERQRVAIARAILRDPAILLLDEATSALDSQNEKLVQGALDRMMREGGRTTFVVAHRLSTIQNADVILVLEKGQIAEKGSHRELLEKEGVYARMYRAQFGERAVPV